jgi:urease accessory protein
MLRITRRAEPTAEPTATLTLPFDRRQKSRLRATLDAPQGPGKEVGIELERGTFLRDGDRLLAESGEVVLVRAEPEAVSVARSAEALGLARAAYHLGNRHVALQILPGELRYQHDHVLDDMVRQLGIAVSAARLPFDPEPGAYGSGHSHQTRGHGHQHGHSHDYDEREHDHDHGGHDHEH